ncbi:MAG: hypothetical protein LBT09_05835 [Planctomycetaceae bacterium]|nr:hypothetical protein [Planctomycetaceae bacterium]
MIFLLRVGDSACSKLTSTEFLFEHRSTGATVRQTDRLPDSSCAESLIQTTAR